jgi:hypothetical protein
MHFAGIIVPFKKGIALTEGSYYHAMHYLDLSWGQMLTAFMRRPDYAIMTVIILLYDIIFPY